VWRPLVARYWAADRVDCVLGIILRESRGDPRAYNSRYGASGLMQHLIKYWPGRAASAGFKDSNGLVASPYNGEANIAAGAAIAGSGSNWYAPWSRLPTYGSCSG
jgi:soluble lytic murein transglycosylase-like protein